VPWGFLLPDTHRVRRGLLLFLTWLTGTAVATTFAWGAVSVVRHNVTDRRVAPLSARAVNEALDTTPDTAPPEETSTTLGPDSGPATPTTVGAPAVATVNGGRPVTTSTTRPRSKTATGGTTSGGTPTGTGGTQTGTGGTSTQPGGGTTVGGGTSASPTTTTTAKPVNRRTFVITNHGQDIGTAEIICNGSVASHGSVFSAQGWSYRVDQNGPDEVIIRFQSNDGQHESKIRGVNKASCDANGQPKATIEESR